MTLMAIVQWSGNDFDVDMGVAYANMYIECMYVRITCALCEHNIPKQFKIVYFKYICI